MDCNVTAQRIALPVLFSGKSSHGLLIIHSILLCPSIVIRQCRSSHKGPMLPVCHQFDYRYMGLQYSGMQDDLQALLIYKNLTDSIGIDLRHDCRFTCPLCVQVASLESQHLVMVKQP